MWSRVPGPQVITQPHPQGTCHGRGPPRKLPLGAYVGTHHLPRNFLLRGKGGGPEAHRSQVSKIKLIYKVIVKTTIVTQSLPRSVSPGLRRTRRWPVLAPHRAKVVKKMCILARKVVTEPCRQSFISTSRAKSRGSSTARCR